LQRIQPDVSWLFHKDQYPSILDENIANVDYSATLPPIKQTQAIEYEYESSSSQTPFFR